MAAAKDAECAITPHIAPMEMLFHSVDTEKPVKFRVSPAMSPDGLSVAVAVNKEVFVYSTANLTVCRPLRVVHRCGIPESCSTDRLHCAPSNGSHSRCLSVQQSREPCTEFSSSMQAMQWSDDSVFLATICSERSSVQVVCPAQPSWGCSVSEGAAGLQTAVWVPAQHVLVTIPDFSLHTSVWHIHSGCSQALPGSKALADGLAFSRSSNRASHWAALLSRQHGSDFLSWYDTSQTLSCGSAALQEPLWGLVGPQEPSLLGTKDAARLLMAAGSHSVWVIDDPLHAYAEEWSVDGTCLHRLSLRVSGLGIVTASAHLSPNGGLLVLPTHSGPVHITNALSHDTLLVASCGKAGQALAGAATDVFVEVPVGLSDADCKLLQQEAGQAADKKRTAVNLVHWRELHEAQQPAGESRFVCCTRDVVPAELLPSAVNEVSPPRLGALVHCSTSTNESLMAMVCSSRPSTVCVFETAAGTDARPVAALCLRSNASSVVWDPSCSRLLVATATANVLVWEPGRAYAIVSQMGRAQAAVVRSLRAPPVAGAPWLLASRGRWCTAHATDQDMPAGPLQGGTMVASSAADS